MRPRGAWRPLLGALVVLLLLGILVDVGARLLTQTWLSAQLRRTLDLPERPSIRLSGFPFLFQVARGRIDRAELDADAVQAQELVLRDVSLELEGIAFSAGDLFRTGTDTVEARRGMARGVVGEEDLTAYLVARNVRLEVTFLRRRVRVTGTFTAGGRDAIATAEGPLVLDGDEVVFMAEEVDVEGAFGVPPEQLSFRVGLPSLGRGVSYHALAVRPAGATVEVRLRDAVVDLTPEDPDEPEDEPEPEEEPEG